MLSLRSIFKPSKKYTLSLCCIEKDENEYLPEWVSFHSAIGVQHFYIYNNDSKISPTQELAPFIEKGIVTIIDFPGKIQQLNAYQHCLDHYGAQSQWIGFIDVDEYIVPKQPNGNLRKLLKQYRKYGGLGINWLLFGSNGHKTRTHRPQVESFTMRSAESFPVNTHIKSIVQPEYTLKAVNPHFCTYIDGKFCVNENFQRIDGPFSEHSSKKIQVNHYHCRSEEEYTDKINRGRADSADIRVASQFHDHDEQSNEVEDEAALNILKKFSF